MLAELDPVIDLLLPWSFAYRRGLGVRDAIARLAEGRDAGPLSPLLCNLYLDTFDRAILAVGHHMARFADAIAVPAEDRGGAERALSHIARELASLRLDLDARRPGWSASTTGCRFSVRR